MGKIHDEASTDKRNPQVNANGPDLRAWTSPTTTSRCSTRTPTPRRCCASRRWRTARRCGRPYAQSGLPAPSAPRGPGTLQPGQHPQPNARQPGPGLVHGDAASSGGPAGLVPLEGSDNKFAPVLPRGTVGPQRELLRPRDAGVHDGGHLLRQPPPAVRARRERDPVPEPAQQRRVRLGRHEAPRRDGRRAAGAGLVPHRGRHQRRRPDHEAVERTAGGARRAVRGGLDGQHLRLRPRARHARHGGRLRHHRQPCRRVGLGAAQDSYPGADRPPGGGRRPARELHRRGVRGALGALERGGERRGRFHAARPSTSIPTASSGTALSGTNHLASFDRKQVRAADGAGGPQRAALRGRLDAPPAAGPHPPGDGRPRRLQLLQLGRSVRHAGPRHERADRHRAPARTR